MAVRPVIRGSANDLMTQQNAAATARFRQPPRPPSSAPASFTTNGPPPPPPPTSTATSFSRAPAAAPVTRPLIGGTGPAANRIDMGPGSFSRTGGEPQLAPGQSTNLNAYMRQPTLPQGQGIAQRPMNGVTAQDMVDVPGVGQLPRAMLQNLQQRMQQRQQPQPTQGISQIGYPLGSPEALQQAEQIRQQQQLRGAQPAMPDPRIYAPDGSRRAVNPEAGIMRDPNGGVGVVAGRPNDNRFGPPVSAGPGPTTGGRWTTAGQGPNMITNPAWGGGGPAPVDPGFDRPYGSDNMVLREPVGGVAQLDPKFGNLGTNPYGNDNIGVGVTLPTMISQPPGDFTTMPIYPNPAPPAMAAPPPPPPPPVAPSLPQQSYVPPPAGAATGEYLWDAATNKWNKAGGNLGPPPPPPSPFAPHVWGGGESGFGAGPNPNPWTGNPYGMGPNLPNLPPAARAATAQAWNAGQYTNPYQGFLPQSPSWY